VAARVGGSLVERRQAGAAAEKAHRRSIAFSPGPVSLEFGC
jgi:hypothetical protein